MGGGIPEAWYIQQQIEHIHTAPSLLPDQVIHLSQMHKPPRALFSSHPSSTLPRKKVNNESWGWATNPPKKWPIFFFKSVNWNCRFPSFRGLKETLRLDRFIAVTPTQLDRYSYTRRNRERERESRTKREIAKLFSLMDVAYGRSAQVRNQFENRKAPTAKENISKSRWNASNGLFQLHRNWTEDRKENRGGSSSRRSLPNPIKRGGRNYMEDECVFFFFFFKVVASRQNQVTLLHPSNSVFSFSFLPT